MSEDVAAGDQGLAVGLLQFELKLDTSQNLDEDGKAGSATVALLRAFQSAHALAPSGVADGATRALLRDRAVAQARALVRPYPLHASTFAVPPPDEVAQALAALRVVPGVGDKTTVYNGRTGFSWGDGPEGSSLRQGSPAHLDWVASGDTTASQRRVIGAVSRNEGPFDAVNSYDAGNYTWGAYQLIGSYRDAPYRASEDELARGLAAIRRLDGEAFFWRFQRYGLDVRFEVLSGGQIDPASVDISLSLPEDPELHGKSVWEKVGSTALYNQLFIDAGQDPRIQRGEVLSSVDVHFDALDGVLEPGKAVVRKYLTSERAVAAFLDLELNRGRASARTIYAASIDVVARAHALPAVDPDAWPEAQRAQLEAEVLQQALSRAPTPRYAARMQRLLGSVFLSDAARSYHD